MTKHKPFQSTDALGILASQIAEMIQTARHRVRQTFNQSMMVNYWKISRLIVEHEQQGQARAAYGKQQLAALSTRLAKQFCKGFDVGNLLNLRRGHLAFPIRETVSPEYALIQLSRKQENK